MSTSKFFLLVNFKGSCFHPSVEHSSTGAGEVESFSIKELLKRQLHPSTSKPEGYSAPTDCCGEVGNSQAHRHPASQCRTPHSCLMKAQRCPLPGARWLCPHTPPDTSEQELHYSVSRKAQVSVIFRAQKHSPWKYSYKSYLSENKTISELIL